MVDAKTTQDVYDRLKALHSENKSGNAAELDRLLRSVGYSGLNDPKFNTSQIEIIKYQGGVAAVMGGGEHQYMYSENCDRKKYEVFTWFPASKSHNDNCDLVIIDVCGNALYCPQPINCQTF